MEPVHVKLEGFAREVIDLMQVVLAEAERDPWKAAYATGKAYGKLHRMSELIEEGCEL